jgi:hypothetical protein
MRKKHLGVVAGAVLAAGLAVPTVASASNGDHHGDSDRACARAFDKAVHEDMDSFNARDMNRYRRILHERVIDNNAGRITIGRDAVLAGGAAVLFPDTTWSFPYTIRNETVYGCESGIAVLDAHWQVPTKNVDVHLVITMTLVRDHGRWQVAIDNTVQPAA